MRGQWLTLLTLPLCLVGLGYVAEGRPGAAIEKGEGGGAFSWSRVVDLDALRARVRPETPAAAARSVLDQVLRTRDLEVRREIHEALSLDSLLAAQVVSESGVVETRVGDAEYRLTLHPRLQPRISSYLRKKDPVVGAFVAIDPRSGRLLALAEHARDPKSRHHPAVSARPPSASTHKILTALAVFMKEPDYDISKKICYHGGFRRLTQRNLRDDPRRDHRCEPLDRAFAKSANAIFGKLSLRHLARADVESLGGALGFGEEPLPFPLLYEPGSLTLADDKWEMARRAAGFWGSHMSPVHGALLASVLAGGGVLHTPYVVDEVVVSGAQRFKARPSEPLRILPSGPVAKVHSLMSQTGEQGTGRKYVRASKLLRKLGVPCKSGTLSGYKGDPLRYTWFIGYAPKDDPTIAFAAMIGNDGRWRIKAGHLMRQALEIYFDGWKEVAELDWDFVALAAR